MYLKHSEVSSTMQQSHARSPVILIHLSLPLQKPPMQADLLGVDDCVAFDLGISAPVPYCITTILLRTQPPSLALHIYLDIPKYSASSSTPIQESNSPCYP